MKKIIGLFVLLFITISCGDTGQTSETFDGDNYKLPEELKGLKVYWVQTSSSNGINVAVLNNEVVSTNYSSGKQTISTIVINKKNNKVIEVSDVIMENDSLIVFRKK